jgi:c-di-GMP-binding flagellar brake protein YcgR
MPEDRRERSRIPIQSSHNQPEASLQINGECHRCTIVNISLGGVCLQLADQIQPAANCSGFLSLANEPSNQNTRHEVHLRWIEQDKEWMLAGFEFSGSDPETYESIRSWLGQPSMQTDDLTGINWL